MLNVSIVRLQPEEWPKYKNLRLEALATDPQAFGTSYATCLELPDDEWERRLVIASDGVSSMLFFAKADDGTLVGMVGGALRDDPPRGVVNAMFVSPEARGQGVSAQLIEALVQAFGKDGTPQTIVLTVGRDQLAAVGLYEKFGFQKTRELVEEMGDGNHYDAWVMGKILNPA